MLHFIGTSILDSQAQTVVNTVNTVGVMGKGLAQAYKERYPKMFEAYKSICSQKLLDVGKLWLWRGSSQLVLNFPTKKHWRLPSKIEYVQAGLEKFVSKYEDQGIREISFPRLGCGNGGLSWDDVRPLMEHYLKPLPISIYIHDFNVDIGAPEHKLIALANRYDYSFDAALENLNSIILKNKGVFKTIFENSSFLASASNFGIIFTTENNISLEVSFDDLYEAWSMLLHAPLVSSKLIGQAKSASTYVLSLFASLSYASAIILRDANATSSTIAVELSDELADEQTLTASA